MKEELLTALYGAGLAALAVVTAVLGVLLRYTPDIVRTFLEKTRLINLERAGTMAVRAVAERTREEPTIAKAETAAQIVKSIAPDAVAKSNAQVSDVVKASVAHRRASMPTPDAMPEIVFPAPSRIPRDT